jgi:hypothetical protein
MEGLGAWTEQRGKGAEEASGAEDAEEIKYLLTPDSWFLTSL